MLGRQTIDLGLERIKTLLEHLGNPHQHLSCIHVAGTNGKGSVCAFVSNILCEAKFKVGRFTSPHLLEARDSITVNLKIIEKERWEDLNARIGVVMEEKKIPATSFEILTAVAFLFFFEEKVDFAVIEVGLGGSLDSTNALPTTTVSVITSISMDHMNMLGNTIQSIATHKAGILKQNGTVIIAPQIPEVLSVIHQVAVSRSVREILTSSSVYHPTLKGHAVTADGFVYPLTLNGDIQLENSAVALAVIRYLREKGFSISDEQILSGFNKTSWPGRNDWKTHPIHGQFLLDGAHNESSAKHLRQYVDSLLSHQTPPPPGSSVLWILAASRGKDLPSILRQLLRPGDALLPVPFTPPAQMAWIQTTDVEGIMEVGKELVKEIGVEMEGSKDWLEALGKAKRYAKHVVVITGSLYLVRDVLAELG